MLIFTQFFSCGGGGSSFSIEAEKLLWFSFSSLSHTLLGFVQEGGFADADVQTEYWGTSSRRALGAELQDIKGQQPDIKPA